MALWPTAVSADDGDNLWGDSAILLADDDHDSLTSMQVVTDGNGGGIFVWRRYLPASEARIEAARVGHNGQIAWSSHIAPANQDLAFSTTTDHRGGVIVAYLNGSDVYAQRLSAAGEQMWISDSPMGTRLSDSVSPFASVPPGLASDGIGGAYVSWANRLVYVEPDGDLSAPGRDGIELIPTGVTVSMVSDGTGGLPPQNLPGGVYAALKNLLPPDYEIRVQYVKNGLQWGADGLILEPDGGIVKTMSSDGHGGLLIGWVPIGEDIRMQRFNSNGETVWPQDVVLDLETPIATMIGDGTGGAYVFYPSGIVTNLDRFGTDGTGLWSVSLGREPHIINMVADGSGGVLLSYDAFWEVRDIGAERFDPDGYRLFRKRVGSTGQEPYAWFPAVAFDGTGPDPRGAVMIWAECESCGIEPPWNSRRVYAQKIEIIDYDPPVNDTCGAAIPVTTGEYTGTLIEATSDGSTNCGSTAGEPDAWYAFAAEYDGLLTVTTCGTNDRYEVDTDMDTVLSLHSTCPGTGSNELICNDDWPTAIPPNACDGIDQGSTLDSAVSAMMGAGERLLIRVSRFGGTIGGHFSLHVDFVPDTDGDGLIDDVDNCSLVMNGGQVDTDRDGLGNICDADFSDDCAINFIDLNIMKQQFFTTDGSPDWDPDVDLNNDGAVNFIDLLVMQSLFFGPPGPAGTPNICEPGCGLRDTGLDPAQHFGVELYVRGSFNAWGSAPPYNLTNFGGGVYRTQVEVAAAEHALKIADELWTLEYDAPTRLLLDVPLLLDGGVPDGSPNISLDLENNACLNFRVEVADPGAPPAQVELTVNRKQ